LRDSSSSIATLVDQPVVGQPLRSANGATTTRFVSVSRAADGCLELSGPFLGDVMGVGYILRELAAAPQIIGSSSTTPHFAVAGAQPRAIVAEHGAKFVDHRIRDCISARPASGWFQP
jgi:hypothetical protein